MSFRASWGSSWPTTTTPPPWPREERTDMATHLVPFKFNDFISDLDLIRPVGSPDTDNIRRIPKNPGLLVSTADVLPQIENPTDRTTISLNVYGRSIVESNQFDLAKKAYTPWKLTYDKPCAC